MTVTKWFASIKNDFNMNTVNSCVFHHSQWESCKETEHVSISYLCYRFVFMVSLISSITFSTLCQSHLFQIFLTNWSFTLQTLYGVISFFNIVWSKHDFLLHTFRIKFCRSYREASSSGRNYEMKETNCYDNMTDAIVHEETTNCVIINNDVVLAEEEQSRQQLNPGKSAVVVAATTDTTNNNPSNNSNDRNKSDANIIINIRSINNNTSNNIRNEKVPTALEKFIWILQNVNQVLPHVVAFGYWVFVYKYDPNQLPCEKFRSHYIVHGACSVLALIDSLIVAVPARKSHFVFPSFVLFVYSIFSFIYEISGGPYRNGKEFIYSILNWRHKPGKTTILVIVGVLLSPIVHWITCVCVHYIKVKLVNCIKRNRK